MKIFTLSCLFVVLAVMAHEVRSQSDEDDVVTTPDTLWGKLKKMVKEFVGSVRGIWKQLKDEINARSTDMRNWTKEMFNAFKSKMFEFVDEMSGASPTEKNDMRRYIEKMEMPKDGQQK